MVWRKLLKVVVEGIGIFLLGLIACLLHYRYSHRSEDFACRWDGSCSGWTQSLVLRNTAGNIEYWLAYSIISTAIRRLHPEVEGLKESRRTITLTWAFILTCGGAHLVTAYSNFNPIYMVETGYLELTAPVSLVAVGFIGAGLIRVRAHAEARRERDRLRIIELERIARP